MIIIFIIVFPTGIITIASIFSCSLLCHIVFKSWEIQQFSGNGCDDSITLKPFWGFCSVSWQKKKISKLSIRVAYNKCMTERILGESCGNSGNFWAASSTFHQAKSVFVILLCDIIVESPTLLTLSTY